MATETYFNDFGTTLNGSVDNSQTTITVNNTAAYPNPFTSLQCHIRIDDEIMLVTAVNTTTSVLTVVRGQETTTALNHQSGAQVVHILTAGGLSNIVSQTLPDVGVTASRPGSYALSGKSYWATNAPTINIWNGSTFTQYYVPLYTPPPLYSTWTAINGSLMVGADTAAGLNVTAISNGAHRGLFRAIPSTPYKVAMTFQMAQATNDSNSYAGAYWLDSISSPDKYVMNVVRGNCCYVCYNGGSFTSSPTFSSIYDPSNITLGMTGSGLIHMILEDDGTDRNIYNSSDGVNFVLGSNWPRARTDNAVMNYIGFGGGGDTRWTVTLVNYRVF